MASAILQPLRIDPGLAEDVFGENLQEILEKLGLGRQGRQSEKPGN